MNHQYPAFSFGSPASLPDAAVLTAVLVTLVIAAALLYKSATLCLDDLSRRVTVTASSNVY